jgi:hypothetical protein
MENKHLFTRLKIVALVGIVVVTAYAGIVSNIIIRLHS